MEAAKFILTQAENKSNYRADIVAYDKEGQAVLLVEVKATELQGKEAKQRAIAQLQLYLQVTEGKIPFAMLVSLAEIVVFSGENINSLEALLSLKTADVLSNYDPEFSNKRIFGYYLHTLTEAWLHDLAYHWKSETPPASAELAAIGLLQRLQGGSTYSEMVLE